MKKEENRSPFMILWKWAKPNHGMFIGAVVLALLGVACYMLPYIMAARLIQLLFVGERNWNMLLPICVVMLISYVGKAVFSTCSTGLAHTATYRTLRDLRKNLVSKLSRVPMGTILDTPSGQYKTTIVDRVEGMEPTLAHLLPEMTSNIIVPIATAVYIFYLDWRMGLASIVTMIIGVAIMAKSGATYAKNWEGAVKVGRTMANAIVEYVGGIQVVKAFSQSAGSYKKYSDAVNENANYYVWWIHQSQKYMAGWQSILPAVLVTVLPVGFILWSSGSLAATTFVMTIILSLGLTGPLLAASSFVDDLAVVGTNVGEINAILEAEELIRPDNEAILNGNKIELENVSFSYGEKNEEVLHDINLTIEEGTVNALVGPSGSGKSTIAKLIAGFWDVSSGSISLGEKDLRHISIDQLNSKIAYVSQDNYMFNISVRENIRMGNPKATDQEVEAAARSCGCEDFILALEHGYDTIAGSGGGHLSGGEKQRISIARAMLKEAPIVILDEATASVDPENEAQIQMAISKLAKGKTLIIIAHRLSTIMDADQIIVVNDGRLETVGTQGKLLESCSLYADMWKAHIDARDVAGEEKKNA